MKIADLYAALALKTDRASFQRGRRDIDRFAKDTDKRLSGFRASLNQRVGSGVRNFAGGLGAGALGAAAFGAALVSTAKDSLAFEESITRLDVSARGAMGTMDQINDRVLKVSDQTGVAKEELMAGSAAFVALTGDGKTAVEQMEVFARTQVATGAAMEDVVGAAAAISQQLGVGSKDFEQMFSILIAGGKAGKIELKDMAGLTASLAANFKQFGGSQGVQGVATLGAAFQVAAQNFGSASEAATGMEALMGSLIQNAKKLKKAGVDIFDSAGNLKSLQDIVGAMSAKNFGPTQLIELLGRKEAFKTFQALRDNRRTWDEMAKATLSAKDVAEDYAKVSESTAIRAKKAWNEVKNAMTAAITPERLEAAAETVKDVGSAAGGWLGIVKKFPGWSLLRGAGTAAGFMTEALTEVGQDPLLRDTPDETLRARAESGRSRLALGGAMPGFDRAQHERVEAELRRRERDRLRQTDYDSRRSGVNPSTFPEQLFDSDAAMRADAIGGPAQQSITLGGLQVTVTVPPGSDADGIAHTVARQIRQMWDTAARDIAAATVD